MPLNFNNSPYFDDFSEDNNYLRLLFQPGRAVQARELTQIQSLLQSQIGSLGDHIFRDGSTVKNGHITYDKTSKFYLMIQPTTGVNGTGSPVAIQQITPGHRVQKLNSAGGRTGISAEIMGVIPAEAGDPNTLYISFNESEGGDENTFGSNQELVVFNPADGQVHYRVRTLAANATTKKAQHMGSSHWLSVEPGIYYWKGMFIHSHGGSLRLSKYGLPPTFIIGFFVEESVVTDDARSLDPAQGSSNYYGVGADRYKIQLTLATVGDGLTFADYGEGYQTVDNFIEICRVDTGNLLRAPGDATLYDDLANRLADRTFETHGNFISRPYQLSFENVTTAAGAEMRAKLLNGVAYVRGYRRGVNRQNSLRILKGRTSEEEVISLPSQYGDNFVIVYDGDSEQTRANGIFTIGSGAGGHTADQVANGFRGEAVSVHCVPHDKVKAYSAENANTWNSTLVATARPMQMAYNATASDKAGSPGDCYNLWLGDVKTSPLVGNTKVTNIITGVGADLTGGTRYTFSSQDHGIVAGDRISVTGSIDSGEWNIDNHLVTVAAADAITVPGSHGTGTIGSVLTLTRTTGNTNPKQTIVLDPNEAAAWNDSYVGATISVEGGAARKIIGYVGANTDATQHLTDPTIHLPSTHPGLVVVDSDFDAEPTYGDSYTINLGMAQARSVVYNSNKDATGAEQYRATINKAWNVDPVSGVDDVGDSSKASSDVYGNRIDGDCIFNRSLDGGDDVLLFPTGSPATKRTMNYGDLDSGFTSNSDIYYTEYIRHSGSSATFHLAPSANYDFFGDVRPVLYPFTAASATLTLDEIKNNFILVNETTSKVITRDITGMTISADGESVTIAPGGLFTASTEYVLIAPVKATSVVPAYKKLIVGNTVAVQTDTLASMYTDLTEGQLQVAAPASYEKKISLNKPDVFKIKRIVHQFRSGLEVDANKDLANTDLDITARFNLNTGQKDMFYDNAYITLKEEAITPSGNLFVCFDYFQRVGGSKGSGAHDTENTDAPSFFSIDSYQTTTDLTFDSNVGETKFAVGDRVKSNSGAVGYVVEYANTSVMFPAKMQLEGTKGTFVVGDTVTAFYGGGTNKFGRIASVVEADLSYTDVPSYQAASGRTYNLRNMIDFRPYVSISGRVSDTLQDSMMLPLPSGSDLGIGKGKNSALSTMRSNHTVESYLGRIDKLILTRDGLYTTITGNPAKNPKPPADRFEHEALTLFNINIPAYTFNINNVSNKRNVALRHTMKDIGRLAKRISNLEHYVSLNTLELAARDADVSFADGTERFKSGILTDNFVGFSQIETGKTTTEQGEGYSRAGAIAAPGEQTFHFRYSSEEPHEGIVSADHDFADGDVVGRILTLDYEPEAFIQQSTASIEESVNPFNLQNYTGVIKLYPNYDRWVDTDTVPVVNESVPGWENLLEVGPGETAADVLTRIEGISGYWSSVGGRPVGAFDSLSGPFEHISNFNPVDGSFDVDTGNRDITLASAHGEVFNPNSMIEASLAANLAKYDRLQSMDGMEQGSAIVPFIRRRDIVVDGRALKPNRNAELSFDGMPTEQLFSRANEIFIDKTDIPAQPAGAEAELKPEGASKIYEKIKLHDDDSGQSANAILIAVRDYHWTDYGATTSDATAAEMENIKVGYIVPEPNTGPKKATIDYSSRADGYYSSGWDSSEIKSGGFQGTGTQRTIEGYDSKRKYELVAATGKINPKNYYNGHYTGTARNADAANTTHVVLSPDASRYIANNFGCDAGIYEGIPSGAVIKIVAGPGAGQEAIIESVSAGSALSIEDNGPVVKLLVDAATGATGISSERPIDNTSVYSLKMKPASPYIRNQGITQLGTSTSLTNSYGDKFGILHLPGGIFPYGRRDVEISDRGDRAEWLITSFASAEYFAEGREIISYDSKSAMQEITNTIEVLKEVKSKACGFQMKGYPGENEPWATNNLGDKEGKLAMVTSINVVNGTYTGTEEYIPGPGIYGEVVNITTNEIEVWDYRSGVGRRRTVTVKDVDV